MTYTPRDIEADRKIIEAATAGPWEAVDEEIETVENYSIKLYYTVLYIDGRRLFRLPATDESKTITRFVAVAHTAWPACLDDIEALRRENVELKAKLAGS